LGFKSLNDAGAWYLTNAPGDYLGLIADFHTLMENMYNKWAQIDVMAKLEHIYKIKLSDISQAMSMASYEAEIPKLPIKDTSEAHSIIKSEESFFHDIKSFDVWDLAHGGIKQRVEEYVQTFVHAQNNPINNLVSTSNPFYQLAIISLNTSVAFLATLFKFMENTYRS
jgi:hypothetical protein